MSDGIPDEIALASDRAAHLVLIALCEADLPLADKAKQILGLITARTEAAVAEEAALVATAAIKRKAVEDELLVCATCHTIYREAENSDTACCFHGGELEETEDTFPDTDPEMLDGFTYEGLREEFPEEFAWSCCKRLGCGDPRLGIDLFVREGCVRDRHEPVAGSEARKRRAVTTAGGIVYVPAGAWSAEAGPWGSGGASDTSSDISDNTDVNGPIGTGYNSASAADDNESDVGDNESDVSDHTEVDTGPCEPESDSDDNTTFDGE